MTSRCSISRILLLCSLLLVSSGLSSQTAPDEMIKINMNKVDIRDVISWMSEQTLKNYIIDPRVKGKLSVLSNKEMTFAEAEQVFLTALDVYGFAIVESGNNVKVIPNAQARSAGLPVVEQFTSNDDGDLVIHVLSVENLAATEVVAILRPLVPQTGHLAAFPSSNSIIIADRVANINRLSALISQIDASGEIDVEVLALKYATAADVVSVISPLVKTAGGRGQQAANGGVQFASDDRSNSILMTGPKESRADVRRLIESLDRPLQGAGNTKVIYLNYIEATEVAGILESITGTIIEEGKDANLSAEAVNIAVSETTNALIISAPPSIIESIEKVIADLDIRRSQVQIEALIVEVSDTFSLDTEVFWGTQNLTGSSPNAAISSANLASPGTIAAAGSESPGAAFVQGGFNWGFYRNGSLRALFRAIETDSSNNVLSRPTIITLDNEEAEVLVGSNVPFVTGSQVNASTTVNNPFQTIERQDIGITLRITPKINKNKTLTLDIEQEVESVRVEAVASASDIVTDKRSIQTQVLLNDREILVLGGLLEDVVTESHTKIPILGDIPLIGKLFRGTSKSVRKQNLMVFVQPTILDSDEDTLDVTRDRYNNIREVQQQKDNRRLRKKDGTLLPEFGSLGKNSEDLPNEPIQNDGSILGALQQEINEANSLDELRNSNSN